MVFDGSLSSWFQFNPATGPETNYVFTNIAAGQTIRLATFVTNGTTVRLKVDTTDIPAAWYFGNNGLAANLNSNAYSLVTISRDSLIPTTNVLVTTRDLELVGGGNITLTTNFPAGTVTIDSTGGGSGITNLFSPTLSNATIKPLVVGVGDLAGATNTTGEIRGIEAGSGVLLTPNGSNYVLSVTSGVLSGTTNFFNLSVQAAKLPATNYPAIDGGWQAWETVYSETNAEGNRATLDASWQFMVPTDYAPNSLKLLINYSLLATNGPNTSNVVWGASILSIRSGTTNNVHTNSFGAYAKGSNDWIAKYDGTNIVTNLVINLDSSGLQARDLSVIKVGRFSTEDTYGGAVSLHGLQLEYTRP